MGIRRPIITFSFSPTKLSSAPLTAASDKTSVVRSNDAADNHELVYKAAREIPKIVTWAVAGSPPDAMTLEFSSSKRTFSVNSPGRKTVSPEV